MLVSICMATYNGDKYIREQVDSILNQEFRENPDVELELVVSDDGSTDDTIKILEAYHDARIVIYHHHNTKRYKYLNANRACKHNLTGFGKNNVFPPLPVKIYFLLVTWTSVIWRSIVRRG